MNAVDRLMEEQKAIGQRWNDLRNETKAVFLEALRLGRKTKNGSAEAKIAAAAEISRAYAELCDMDRCFLADDRDEVLRLLA